MTFRWGALRAAFAIVLAASGAFGVVALPSHGLSSAFASTSGDQELSGAQSLTVGDWTRPEFDRDTYSATSMAELLAARAAAAAAAAAEAAAAAAEAAIAAMESAKLESAVSQDTPTRDSESLSDPYDSELSAFLVGRSTSWTRPVDAPISSPYGPRDIICNPAGCSNAFHDGVDFGAACGTPVAAVSAGRVVFAGPAGGYGNRVIVDHGSGIESIYGHIGGDSYAVAVGDLIETGTVVGEVGVTGVTTGCHLDLKIRVNGEYLSPLHYLLARGVTV
ncbi:murein DD-endopeptidase MepM/ murein hydrolase activator NlpD [Okibacterium sp. HSC-33S16]|uniref:M23 family metallopeptidase n=1 Tax=Okibacterium sp. HSC-33S16 TaxID=2910965 RepID=UPI00209F7AC9|nr:peptidoglycan DD-metalloendopeptidase family protein [Okibacterium sp. HSC-33S16]MCP2030215.1 murein DD-endopeptidase MepM/ murein hydrolase activator NlpD [Okibacterium sp. HSC-33S16]